jgi:uncharacterized protein (DUF2141 family)
MRPFPLASWLVPAAALVAAPAFAQGDCTGTPSAVRFYVNVENVRSSRGLIAVTLYPDESRRFLARRGSLYVGRVPARAGTTRVCIHLPSTGTWVFGVYHDEDGSRTINRNSIGLPREGFGFSNNPRTLFSVPSFRSVRLAVPRSNMQTTIRLRYP